VGIHGVFFPVYSDVYVTGHFNDPAQAGRCHSSSAAFSRKKYAGVAVSPTAKPLKWPSHFANIVTRKAYPVNNTIEIHLKKVFQSRIR
jgi:hypothetical protein